MSCSYVCGTYTHAASKSESHNIRADARIEDDKLPIICSPLLGEAMHTSGMRACHGCMEGWRAGWTCVK